MSERTSTWTSSGGRAAFFDVDETLVDLKTMAAFLDHVQGPAQPVGPWARFVASLPEGLPRTEVNRLYYRLWRGRQVEEVLAEGRRWWSTVVDHDELFLREANAALRAHAAAGDLVVLVSGSFPAPLTPLAEHLGADVVLCTEPLSEAGVLTGDIRAPMIGPHKAEAVRALIDERGLRAADCFAYGDHESDIPMLEVVGHPRPVGTNATLLEHAAKNGWLPDTPRSSESPADGSLVTSSAVTKP